MDDVETFDPTVHGLLAKRYCNVTERLKVLQSAAGYYIGTWTDEGPMSRESEYFATYDEAEQALFSVSWTQRTRP